MRLFLLATMLIARMHVARMHVARMHVARMHVATKKVSDCSHALLVFLQAHPCNERKHHTIINASRMFVVFCKPILAMLLQRKRPIARMHLA